MSVDFDFLTRQYFYFDKPVPYNINENQKLFIAPIYVEDFEIFSSSVPVISFEKDNVPDPKIIQMSYLQFVVEVLIPNSEEARQGLINICKLCLGIDRPGITKNELGRICLVDQDTGIVINAKQFDEIRSIIMKQNFINYDDEYINPELKKALQETKELRNKNIEVPTLERKIAIITAHCGLSKKEQLNMTYRSHELLFDEVCGEVKFTTCTPAILFGGKGKEIEDWIFKKKKGKFDGDVISVSDYNKSGGGDGNIAMIQQTSQQDLLNQLKK